MPQIGQVLVALGQNIALLLALIFLYRLVHMRVVPAGSRLPPVLLGLLFGGIALLGMLMPIEIAPGIVIDGRVIMVTLAGLFGGPIAAVSAAGPIVLYRLSIGGAGTIGGIGAILTGAVLGALAWRRWGQPTRLLSPGAFGLFGLLIAGTSLLWTALLPAEMIWSSLQSFALPVLIVYPLGTILLGTLFAQEQRYQATEAAQRASEARYRTLVEHFPNGAVLLFDHELRYTLAGGTGLAEVGLSKALLEGKTIAEAFPPETCRAIEPAYQAALAGTPMITEVPFQGLVYRLHTLPVPDARGRITAGMAMTQDITADTRAAAALRESEERSARLAEAAFEGIMFSESGIIREVNGRLASMIGYQREELIGRPVDEIVAPASRDLVRRRIKTAYHGRYELLVQHKNGTIFPVEVQARPAQYQGRPIRVTAVHDMRERIAAEQALARSEKMFKDLVQSLNAVVWEADAQTFEFSFVSEQAVQLLGYPVADWLASPTFWADHIHPADRAGAVDYCVSCTQALEHHEFEYRMIAANGRVVWLRDFVTVIAEGGQPARLRGVMVDITARRRAEQELRLIQTTALAISATSDLQAALAVTLQQVCEATGWALGQAWIPSAGAPALECTAAWTGGIPELEPFRCASTGISLPPGVGLPGRVWQAQRAIWVQDVTQDPNFPRASFAREAGLKAAMAFPVLAGADIVAILEFFVREPRAEDDQLISLISTVAAQLGTEIQRKQAEDALRASEERYRRIVETAEEGIWTLDCANITTFVNPKLARWLGYAEDEMIGRPVFGFLAEEERARVLERLERRRHGISEQHEVRLCRKDGTALWAIVSASPIQDHQGQYAGALAMLTDITARKQAEALRAGQNQLLEMIATNAALEDVLTSLIRLIEAQSEGMVCSILLLDEDGQHVRHAAAPSLPEAYIKAIDGSLIGPAAGSCGTAIYRGEPVIVTDILQDPLWVDYRDLAAPHELRACWSTPIISHEGQVFGSFAMYYDKVRSPSQAETYLNGIAIHIAGIAIGRRRTEQELRKHREHLEDLIVARTTELAIAKDKAEEADRLKSAFLATMSHELRTPLNSIIGFTGILLQGLVGPLNDEQQKQLGMVKSSARHLLNLINDVLDISKIEAGQVELHLEPFDMRSLIDKTVKTVAPLVAKKQLAVIVDVAPEVEQVTSDRRRVEQILLNLVSNAIKFTEQGEIRIECRIHDSRLWTSVTDTGIGIKPEDMAKLFTTFRQLDSRLSRKHDGTGLGLAICKKLIELLGGEIRAESVWEGGSIFTFALPSETI